MTNQDVETKNRRILELAQEIERNANLEEGSSQHSLQNNPTFDDDELDESDREELIRFQGALAYLHKLRNKITQDSVDESIELAGDPTRPDLRGQHESAEGRPATFGTPTGKIGRFEIQSVLGQGGFAQVFLARDPNLDRLIAMKIPKPSVLVSEESRRRFEREARAAAVLSHPNIVPVFESGSFGPITYIASSYCAGETLGEWFNSKSRKIDDRTAVEIVARLAEAVEHAHQRGVIHRDLKPGNILVESESPAQLGPEELTSQLRIADFGLAKVEHCNDQTLTTAGAIVGTPAYMSPEQARGDAEIESTTDIYSLGVILYELLTGTLPHHCETHIATLKAVESTNPKSPRSHRNSIPLDVEAICLKALSKSKQDRYQSAYLLSADLQRWLDGQPITARKTSRLQRLSTWSKRNPAIAVSLSFAILSLTAGLIATGWQWRKSEINALKADSQRGRAERHLARLESTMDDVLRDIAISLRDSPGMSSLREKVLTMSLEIQTGLIAEEQDNPKVRAGTVRALVRMAEIQRMLGNYATASKNASEAISLINETDPSAEHHDELQRLLVELYEEQAQILFDQNRHQKALSLLEEGIDIANMIEAGPAADHRYRRAQLYRMQGVAFEKTNQFEKAETAYDKALAEAGDLESDHGFELDYAAAAAMTSKAILLKNTGRSDQAIPLYLESFEIMNRLLGSQPHRPDLRKSCATIQYNLGALFYAKREFEAAAHHYEIALEELSTLSQISPRNDIYAGHYANALGTYGSTMVKLRQVDAAKENFEKAIEVAEQFPESVRVQIGFLSTLNNYARFQRSELHQDESAEETFWRVVAGCQAGIARAPGDLYLRKSLAVALGNLTNLYIDRKNWLRAEELADQQLDSIRSAHLANPKNKEYQDRTAAALSQLSRIMIHRQNLDAAFDFADQLVDLNAESTDLAYRSARLHCRMYAELEAMLNDPDNEVSEDELKQQMEQVLSRGFEKLKSAIEFGFNRIDIVETKDRIWSPFRDHPEFQEILEFMKDLYGTRM